MQCAPFLERPLMADAVEKLLDDLCREVFRGLPTITRVTIVDPERF